MPSMGWDELIANGGLMTSPVHVSKATATAMRGTAGSKWKAVL